MTCNSVRNRCVWRRWRKQRGEYPQHGASCSVDWHRGQDAICGASKPELLSDFRVVARGSGRDGGRWCPCATSEGSRDKVNVPMAKASREQPRWISVDVHAVEQGCYLPLAEMRTMPELEEMVLLQKGSRLSISPVSAGQWKAILKRVRQKATKS